MRKRAAKQTLPSASSRTHSATATHCLLAVPPVQLFCLLFGKVLSVCFRMIFPTRASLYRRSSRLHVRARTCSELPIALPSPPSLFQKRGGLFFFPLSLWRRSFGVPFFSLALLFASAGGGDNTCHGGRGGGAAPSVVDAPGGGTPLFSRPGRSKSCFLLTSPLLYDGGVGGPVGNIGQK